MAESTDKDSNKKKFCNVPFKGKLSLKDVSKKKKFTKENLRKTTERKIPRKILNDILEMLRNNNHPIWKENNLSCNPSIHRYYQDPVKITEIDVKLKCARQCLLRRDWANLLRILTLCSTEQKAMLYYPLFLKYGALCLAHIDRRNFKKFMEMILLDSKSIDIIKKCTKIGHQLSGENIQTTVKSRIRKKEYFKSIN